MIQSRFNIGKLSLLITNIQHTLTVLEKQIEQGGCGYVCVTNERTTYLANLDDTYCAILNNSLLSVPDGTPLVWIAHDRWHKSVGKVSGKDLMDAVFSLSSEKGYSPFFWGSTPDTIEINKSNARLS